MAKRPITAEDLLKIVSVGDPQISPDGSRVLYARKIVTEKNKYLTHLHAVDIAGDDRQLTQGPDSASAGRWSPDGSEIAFISTRNEKIPQIYILSLNGGEARKLTDLPEGSIGEYRWSPDGKRIAFSFRETDPTWTQKAQKEREEKGLSTPAREIDSVWYRLDGDGYFLNQRYALYVVEVASGKSTKLYSAAPDGFYSFDWSPDSKELVVAHTASKNPFFETPNTQLYRVTLDGKAKMIQGLPKGDKSSVRWSPDGKWIAYLGDVDENDPWGVRNTRAFVVGADGKSYRCLTDGEDYDLNVATLSDAKEASFDGTLFWSPDSKALYVLVGWHGECQLGYIDVANGGTRLLTKGPHQITVGNVSNDGVRFGAIWGDATTFYEVGVYDLDDKNRDKPRVLTKHNQALQAELDLSTPQEHWVETTDGLTVHTWILMPPGKSKDKKHPAILQIHGGPHTQYGWAVFHEFQLLAAQGFVVVYSNPRGSKGYGEDWCAAIKGDWGNKDWEDVQAVTKWMKRHPSIDSKRMGVMGGSYGGYMTNWVIGHTNEFAAAITDRCVSNLVSMAGTSDFPMNKNAYFGGCAWGDLEEIRPLWRQSPLAYFENVETPTLVIHSEGDLRCNIEQGEQVFHALQAQGVPSRFVRYPQSTFHGLSRNGPPDLRLHRLGEIVKWMERWLKSAKVAK